MDCDLPAPLDVESKGMTGGYVGVRRQSRRSDPTKIIYPGIFSNFFRAGSKLSQLWPRAV
jgi:hypothetical protein